MFRVSWITTLILNLFIFHFPGFPISLNKGVPSPPMLQDLAKYMPEDKLVVPPIKKPLDGWACDLRAAARLMSHTMGT